MAKGSADVGSLSMSEPSRRILIELSDLATLPQRVPLIPVPGDYDHPAYGTISLSAERIDRFVANHNARVYQQRIPIDAEHETKLSGALGYLGDARVEPNGSVSAAVEWTPRGERLVTGGGFRYVSPEWYDDWSDPATGETFDDVIIGLAITTRPFFKETALPPLVARGDGLDVPQNTAGGETPQTARMETVISRTKESMVSETPEPKSMTEDQVNAIVKGRLDEQAQQFSERIAAVEAENVRLKNETRMRQFREEVTGKSDANGVAWFGDLDTHIKVMDSLSDDDRTLYIEQQRQVAKMVRESGIFRETGSGHGKTTGSALEEITAKAEKLAADKGMTREQAFAEVVTTDKALAARYAAERG